MEFKICENCCMIFQHRGDGEVLCPECIKKDDEDSEKIRDFLIENPNAKEAEISEKTGVSMSSITKLIKIGKVVIRGKKVPALTCKMCGISITSGKYCADCKRKFMPGYGETSRNTAATGMRFIRR